MEIQYDYDNINMFNKYKPVNDKTAAHNNFAMNTETEECINIIDYAEINKESHLNTQQSHLTVLNAESEENVKQIGDRSERMKKDDEMEVDDKTDSDDNVQAVSVPFKVLEELHRVKAFLNKKDRRYTDGYSTDSGYRSDSQVRGTFKNCKCKQF